MGLIPSGSMIIVVAQGSTLRSLGQICDQVGPMVPLSPLTESVYVDLVMQNPSCCLGSTLDLLLFLYGILLWCFLNQQDSIIISNQVIIQFLPSDCGTSETHALRVINSGQTHQILIPFREWDFQGFSVSRFWLTKQTASHNSLYIQKYYSPPNVADCDMVDMRSWVLHPLDLLASFSLRFLFVAFQEKSFCTLFSPLLFNQKWEKSSLTLGWTQISILWENPPGYPNGIILPRRYRSNA